MVVKVRKVRGADGMQAGGWLPRGASASETHATGRMGTGGRRAVCVCVCVCVGVWVKCISCVSGGGRVCEMHLMCGRGGGFSDNMSKR